MIWKQIGNWLLFIFLLTSVSGALLFIANASHKFFYETHNYLFAVMCIYYVCGIITLIIMMKEVE